MLQVRAQFSPLIYRRPAKNLGRDRLYCAHNSLCKLYYSSCVNQAKNEIINWFDNQHKKFKSGLRTNDTISTTPQESPITVNNKSNKARLESDYHIIPDSNFPFARINAISIAKSGNIATLLQELIKNNRRLTVDQLIYVIDKYTAMNKLHDIHEFVVRMIDNFDMKIYEKDPRYYELIGKVLRVEFCLKHYSTCERLFSAYIRKPFVEGNIISIGLRCFLERNNFQLAKEFYLQAISNPDTYEFRAQQLHVIIKKLYQSYDLSNMKMILARWFQMYRLSEEHTTMKKNFKPYVETLSLYHRLLLMHNDRPSLEKFFKEEVVVQMNYATSISSEIDRLVNEVYSMKSLSKQQICDNECQAKIREVIMKIEKSHGHLKEPFYRDILKAAISLNKFSLIKFIMQIIHEDADITDRLTLNLIATEYFVKNGSFDKLYEVMESILSSRNTPNDSNSSLKCIVITQLWECALQKYPLLSSALCNELRLVLNKHEYKDKYPWTKELISKANKLRKIGGSNRLRVTSLSQHEFSKLMKILDQLQSKDTVALECTVTDTLREGILPSFYFYYEILRQCVAKSYLGLARLIEDIIRHNYHYVPLKLDILWLKQDVLTHASERNFRESRRLIRDFTLRHREELNFQNCIQLAQLSIRVRDYRESKHLLGLSAIRLNSNFPKQIVQQEMTTLHMLACSHQMSEFLWEIRNWRNRESHNVEHISRDDIRRLRCWSRYFTKRQQQIAEYDENITKMIDMEIKELVSIYAARRFQGLNDIRRLMYLVQQTLDGKESDLRDNRST